MTDLLSFLRRIDKSSLRRAPKVKGKAGANFQTGASPYKPVLLLAIIGNLNSKGSPFSRGIVRFEDCEEPFFKTYNSLLKPLKASEMKIEKVVQPFWYFGTGAPRVWTLNPAEGKGSELRSTIQSGVQIKTRQKLDALVDSAEFSLSDMQLLADPVANRAIEAFILNEYFLT